LQTLSHRIARNREIAGLHYPSDSHAGRELARQTFAILQKGPLFQKLLVDATAEWTL
jgi:hypothetical protein